MSDKLERHHLYWSGIHVYIEYDPEWSTIMSESYGCNMAHLGITSQDREPLPFTETGYRSDFQPVKVIEEGGGVVKYVRLWLDDAATSPKWAESCDMNRQQELF